MTFTSFRKSKMATGDDERFVSEPDYGQFIAVQFDHAPQPPNVRPENDRHPR
jgi:hypothetical protein